MEFTYLDVLTWCYS